MVPHCGQSPFEVASNPSLQVRKFKKSKFYDPKVPLCIVIVLSCSKKNTIEQDFGVLGFVLLKLFYLYKGQIFREGQIF
jgi:hypothetical protein